MDSITIIAGLDSTEVVKMDLLETIQIANQNLIYALEKTRIINWMSDDLLWAIIGGIIGLCLSGLIWSLKRICENLQFKRDYDQYEGMYVSYLANNLEDPHYVIQMKRKRNEFNLRGVSVKRVNGELKKRHENISGHIIMGTSSKKFGTGQYQHDPDNENRIRSGEYKIQLAPNCKIIAIQHIIDNQLNESIPKYEWIKLTDKIDDFEKLKKIYQQLIK